MKPSRLLLGLALAALLVSGCDSNSADPPPEPAQPTGTASSPPKAGKKPPPSQKAVRVGKIRNDL